MGILRKLQSLSIWADWVARTEIFRDIRFLYKIGWNINVYNKAPLVICYGFAHGLCDRLRSYVSVYSVCKRHKIPFRIFQNTPFDLRLFIEPNLYDWDIEESEITPPGTSFEELKFWSMAGGSLEPLALRYRLERRITHSVVKQIIAQGNCCTIRRNKLFSKLFQELFRPSKIVQEQLNLYKGITGEGYISVSSRFAGLIGDFNETYNEPLPKNERELLLNNCIKQIEELHRQHLNKKILVCSDSITFLEMTKQLPYAVVIEGEPVHINFTEKKDIGTHLKTFVDFYMIAGAQKVYLLVGGKMYRSGFPQTAALSHNKPFKIIQF